MGAENAIRYTAEVEPMPLSALCFYIESKFKHEYLHDEYLFNSLRGILLKRPDGYYEQYPIWQEINSMGQKPAKAKKQSFDEIVDNIISKL